MIKKLILVLLVLSAITTFAQRNSASPYSYFGIGETFEATTVENASMGRIGVALNDTHHLNFVNPAANASLRVATYGIGASSNFLTLEKENTSNSGSSTSLRYVSLGFPLGKKAGLSVGLQPFTSVGYSLLDTQIKDEITSFKGEGGTNKIYASFGTYIVKGLSVGLEAGYVFGNLENNVIHQKNGIPLATKYQDKVDVRGGLLKFGAQYKTLLNDKINLYTGASFSFKNDLSTKGNKKMSSIILNVSGQETEKKQFFSRAVNGDITIPMKSIFGFGLGKENKWYLGVNQEFKSALNSGNNLAIGGNGYKYDDSSRLSIGGYYIPKINSISNYWKRVTYRAGMRFEDTGLLIQTGTDFTEIKDFGINVGLGLPLPRQLSNVNIGLEYGQKGTVSNNLIKEKYFNVRLSLSLNSTKWFHKRKID
ncbi:hypothetical protein [Tenacibaculum finnmarkense]|uniref:Outer membrane protein n=1 Tax=Tenacibaculum finnmarkense genomovar ulcerans TaxID=2781388 RepID=A0A2I2M8D3_9FLAO|nr:hypothetical protein [Tenacibaculum finnmarkense]ALU75608.1 hypothetical protein AUW17_10235 [Tenacibaculum dicentrarchi]MBE7633032.1 hypothetical protein [Tenacibaculum finnmarkense genomovar ulcerans]MBE7644684.1 hypothetical protein [Tenacibaculum finnmarkense genomovar ulcerans]MBE7697016.1 hypothetical protein [Tenacibaculum finnmarkense genomovar ulcerans]MCD8421969.1 hypothetical protein [Tenacibaculum finnmarkense genomovar ulcerans]